MTLEKVVQEILDRGKKECDAIVDSARKEADGIIKEARERAAQSKSEKEAEAVKVVERMRKQEIPSAEIEAKKIKLNAEKEVLDGVYIEVIRRLSSLPREKNEALLRALVSRAAKEYSNGTFYSNARDAEIVREKVRFGGVINCTGGIVVETEDKTVRVDCTYEALLGEVWNASLRKVYDILLGNNV
jgi:V/A-type H+-transporting ATPase subunit E